MPDSSATGVAPARISANLDMLRTVAVLSVLISHAADASDAEWLPETGSLGRFGVLLFFVHTSMVLMMSLYRSEATTRAELTAGFYIRRAFRIYPLSILCVLAVLWLNVPGDFNGDLAPRPASAIAANLLNAQNIFYQPNLIGPLWSLPLEVEMYLFLPFLYLLISGIKRGRIALLVTLWALGVAGAFLQPHVSGRLDVAQYVPCFLPGVSAFFLQFFPRLRLPSWLWPVWIFSVLAWFGPFDDIPLPAKFVKAWTACALIGIAIPQFAESRSTVANTFTRYVCRYSYGIYLSHQVLLWLVFRHWHVAAGVDWLVFTALMFVVPVLSYHFVEDPLIAIGNNVARFAVQAGKELSRGATA